MNWARSEEDRERLRIAFPDCFAAKGETKRPLAIGIHKAIAEALPDMSKTRIRQALQNYVTGPTYLGNMLPGVVRIGLLGNDAGTVSKEDCDRAKAQLKAMRKRWKVKQAARTNAKENGDDPALC